MKNHWIMALATLALASIASAQHEQTQADPGQLFKAACEDETETQDRLDALAKIVNQHAKTKWADDALWLMGEICAQHKRRDQALRLKKQLVKSYPFCHLEPYTKTLRAYKKSSIPMLRNLYEAMGYVASVRKRKLVPINPVPMAINHDIAVICERKGKYIEAKRYYEATLKQTPPTGMLAEFLRKAYERVKRKAEIQQRLEKQRARHKTESPAAQQP